MFNLYLLTNFPKDQTNLKNNNKVFMHWDFTFYIKLFGDQACFLSIFYISTL